MNYIDPEGVTWRNFNEYILIGKLGLCGCIDTEIEADILEVFKTYKENSSVYYTQFTRILGPEKYKELILHVLDNAGYLEHGTSIRGSWLTEEGRIVAHKLTY